MPEQLANDMTTDEIVADVRRRMAEHPKYAAALQDVADRFVRQLRTRLPYIDETEMGAVVVNVSAYMTAALQLFAGEGLDSAGAAQAVANVVAMAGAQLYGPNTT